MTANLVSVHTCLHTHVRANTHTQNLTGSLLKRIHNSKPSLPADSATLRCVSLDKSLHFSGLCSLSHKRPPKYHQSSGLLGRPSIEEVLGTSAPRLYTSDGITVSPRLCEPPICQSLLKTGFSV